MTSKLLVTNHILFFPNNICSIKQLLTPYLKKKVKSRGEELSKGDLFVEEIFSGIRKL